MYLPLKGESDERNTNPYHRPFLYRDDDPCGLHDGARI